VESLSEHPVRTSATAASASTAAASLSHLHLTAAEVTVAVVATEKGSEFLWRALLVVLGAWSILPPYIGPGLGMELDVSSDVEFIDHAVPGAVVVICGTVSVILARGGAAGTLADVIALGACCLAGFWEVATHFTLWLDAGDPGKPWDAVLLHTTAGPLITTLAAWLLLRAPAMAVDERGREP
jgi:hypothetical protein